MKVSKEKKKKFYKIVLQRKLYPVYQPIVSLKDGSIYGYEALTRIDTKSQFNIEELFKIANELGWTWKLESICRKMALKKTDNNLNDKKIFLNVSPCVIQDPLFKSGTTAEYLKKYDLNPKNVVFEITERHSIDNESAFTETIQHYKESGYEIAVDDYGTEHAGIQRVCLLNPHFIKIDMSIVRDVDKDYLKRMMIKSMVIFCKTANIKLIAEGIETQEELDTLIKLEVDYGQGYFLSRPDRALLPLADYIENHICDINNSNNENKTTPLFQYINNHDESDILTITNSSNEIITKLSCKNIKELLL